MDDMICATFPSRMADDISPRFNNIPASSSVQPVMPSDRFAAPAALFQTAGIAHELGRSIATKADLSERLAPGDDWAEKAAANYYAFRWGMADMIAEARGRQAHPRFTLWLCGTFADAFAVLPGFEPEARGETSRPPLGDPSVYWWRVDDEFVFHHCPVCRGWPTFDEACRHPLEEYERGCPRSFRFSENG